MTAGNKGKYQRTAVLSLCCFQLLWLEDVRGHLPNHTAQVSASTLQQHDVHLENVFLWFYKLAEQTQISTNKGVIFYIMIFIFTVIVMGSIIVMLWTLASPLFMAKLDFTVLKRCIYLNLPCPHGSVTDGLFLSGCCAFQPTLSWFLPMLSLGHSSAWLGQRLSGKWRSILL